MDLRPLADRLGLDLPDFIELVDLFVLTSQRDLSRLERALQDQDARKASEAAHSLKGAAANLGFDHMAERADRIERETRAGQIAPALPFLPELRQQLATIEKLAAEPMP